MPLGSQLEQPSSVAITRPARSAVVRLASRVFCVYLLMLVVDAACPTESIRNPSDSAVCVTGGTVW